MVLRPDSRRLQIRDATRLRGCILPVDGFYEWKAIKAQRAKQPYAVAMKDASPFGIAGLWRVSPRYSATFRNTAVCRHDDE
jgi:putative SOS response-associated peptidase YedK